MKKTILLFIISILLLVNVSFADTNEKATVNVTAVRIREKASTDSDIVTNIYQDDEVEILEEDGDWYKVQYNDDIGYAKAEFFTKTEKVATENNVVPEDTDTIQTNLSNSFKLRTTPSFSSAEKIEMENTSDVTIETKLGKWYKLTDNTNSGWITIAKYDAQMQEMTAEQNTQPEEQPEEVPEENLEETEESPETTDTASNKTGIIIVETARVRKAASATADIVTTLDEDTVVTILGEEGDFYKISTDSITEGYISKSLVKEKDVTSRSLTEEREDTVNIVENEAVNQALVQGTTSSTTGEEVVAFAKQYLGYPYVLGASSPEKGFDCSGFTRYVFAHFGYTLGQVAADQTSLGEVVDRNNLQVGDLILFYNDGKTKIGHCGIYLGDGNFIHSANPQRGVVIDNLNTNSYYNSRFVTARRII